MKKSFGKKTAILIALLSTTQFANADSKRKFYIGAEYGGFMPLSKKFKIDDMNVRARGGLGTIGARLGYQFYPDMYIDLSWTKRENLKLSSSLDTGLPPGVKFAWGSAKLKYESYIVSIKYAMPLESKITPYIGAGIGVAKLGVRKQDKVYVDIPAIPGVVPAFKGHSGRVIASTKITPAVRVYAGADTKVSEFLSLYLDAKIEMTKKVPVKFEIDNPYTNQLDMKKTVKSRAGIAEAVLGVRFSF